MCSVLIIFPLNRFVKNNEQDSAKHLLDCVIKEKKKNFPLLFFALHNLIKVNIHYRHENTSACASVVSGEHTLDLHYYLEKKKTIAGV